MTQAFNLSQFANKVNTSGQADLTTAVTGTLPIANGGTNNGSLAVTAGGVVYTDGTKLVNVGAGTAGQVLNSNGASAPTWGSVSGIVSWQSVQTSNFAASANSGYPVNTTSGSITVTFPASPSAGNLISIIDYAGTAATNNIIINFNGKKYNSVTSNGTIATNRTGLTLVYIDSTQGWLSLCDVYSSVPITQTYSASYLVVAGGGAGGSDRAGGGGAGGLLSGTATLTAGVVYTATVGAGGTATTGAGGNGSNSVLSGTGITTQTSVGGGGGAPPSSINGLSGGSGGGGNTPSGAGGSGTSGQGNAGGTGGASGGNYPSGGGGGAGAAGGNASSTSGNGGAGSASSITGSSVTYAGGGGGGAFSGAASSGGAGGGGAGSSSGVGTAGTANTGGGGGGGGAVGGVSGGNGGSGVVILSVPTANYSSTTTGSPTITTSGSNTIIKFTSSGTYTA